MNPLIIVRLTVASAAARRGWLAVLLLLCMAAGAGDRPFDFSLRPDLLTTEEKQWLDAHPIIRIAASRKYEPIESMDENAGGYSGVTSEYFSLMAGRLGRRFQFVSPSDKQWLQLDPKLRGADVITASAETPERVKYWSFTTSYLSLPTYLITRRTAKDDLTLKDLAGGRVAVVAGWAAEEYLRTHFPGIQIDPVPDAATGLRKASFGLADAFVSELPVATEWMEREAITNLKIAGEAGYTYHLGISVRKDWPELRGIFEKALATITPAERKDIYKRWVKMQQPQTNEQLRRTILWGGAGLLALLAAAVVWNRTLASRVRAQTAEVRAELARRIEADAALRDSEEKFSKAFRSSPDVSFITRVSDGRVIEANASTERIYASPREGLIGHRTFGEGWGWVSAEERGRFIEALRRGGGTLHDFETRHRRMTGEVFTALVSCETVEIKGEQCIIGVLRDVSVQRAAEAAVRAERDFSDAVIAGLPGVFYLVDPARRLLRWNKNFEIVSGWSPEDLGALDAARLFRAEDLPAVENSFRAVIEHGASSVEVPLLARDGRLTPHFFTGLRVMVGGVPCMAGVGVDISERLRAESALVASEQRFSKAFRNSPVAMCITTLGEGRLLDVNEEFMRMHGVASREDLVGRTTMELGLWSETAERAVFMERLRAEGRFVNLKRHFLRISGGTGMGLHSAELIELGGVPCAIVLINDITEREAAEEALRISEEKFARAFRNSPDAILLASLPSGEIIEVNESACRLTGYDRAEIIGRTSVELNFWHSTAVRERYLAALRDTGRMLEFEAEFCVKGGQVRLGLVSAEVIKMPAAPLVVVTVRDITERKRAEAERQRLNAQLLESEDEERRRIARELHDTTAQHLAVIQMNLTRLRDGGPAAGDGRLLAESLSLTAQSVQEIRTLSYLLHPPLLDELGLAGALGDFAAGFARRTGIRVEVDTAGYTARVPREQEIAFFRVAQESLANVHRHSRSAVVVMRLECDADEVRLEIQDDGRGISRDALPGVGLRGMRERLLRIGGELHIESDAEGTTVLASAPAGKIHTAGIEHPPPPSNPGTSPNPA